MLVTRLDQYLENNTLPPLRIDARESEWLEGDHIRLGDSQDLDDSDEYEEQEEGESYADYQGEIIDELFDTRGQLKH